MAVLEPWHFTRQYACYICNYNGWTTKFPLYREGSHYYINEPRDRDAVYYCNICWKYWGVSVGKHPYQFGRPWGGKGRHVGKDRHQPFTQNSSSGSNQLLQPLQFTPPHAMPKRTVEVMDVDGQGGCHRGRAFTKKAYFCESCTTELGICDYFEFIGDFLLCGQCSPSFARLFYMPPKFDAASSASTCTVLVELPPAHNYKYGCWKLARTVVEKSKPY